MGCYSFEGIGGRGNDIRQSANWILAVRIVPRRAGLFRLVLSRPL